MTDQREQGEPTGRERADYDYERGVIDQAHAQNEAGRDAFVAVAHTALFAASIAFVGDVAPLQEAVWKPLLTAGWASSVIGLFCLTLSFSAARKAIDARRAALNDTAAPSSDQAVLLNSIALWSFPVSLLCLFLFTTANVWTPMSDRNDRPPPSRIPGIERRGSAPPPRAPEYRPTPGTGVVPAPRAPVHQPSAPPPSPSKKA